ncbi:MAG: hypothetical protein OEZ55_07990 [Nitrospinota bacterium]|nr:hypothetical protein [Nitrospinota bacterium]MDH5756589.1 hypothetical protein [Nitrospinota bacterium]
MAAHPEDADASGPSHREGIENIVGEILFGSKWMGLAGTICSGEV